MNILSYSGHCARVHSPQPTISPLAFVGISAVIEVSRASISLTGWESEHDRLM
jgi:hypothetical protein